jgi:hypothetical protein
MNRPHLASTFGWSTELPENATGMDFQPDRSGIVYGVVEEVFGAAMENIGEEMDVFDGDLCTSP